MNSDNIKAIILDKATKNKEKVEVLSNQLLENVISINDLLEYAVGAKDVIKATCIESLEFATKQNPKLINHDAIEFLTASLAEKAPRVKWESAKVIANVSSLLPNDIDEILVNLKNNARHSGTVVRWSSALALGEILIHRLNANEDFINQIHELCDSEEKNSIKKIYLAALKKIMKKQ